MPEKVVAVEGLGNVAFPDSMSDDAVASAIKAQLGPEKRGYLKSLYDSTIGGVVNNISDYVKNGPPAAQGLKSVARGLELTHKAETGKLSADEQSELDAIDKQDLPQADSSLSQHPAVAPLARAMQQVHEGDLSGAAGTMSAYPAVALAARAAPAVARVPGKLLELAKQVPPEGIGGAVGASVGAMAGHVIPIPGASAAGAFIGRDLGKSIGRQFAGKQPIPIRPEAINELPKTASEPAPSPQSDLMDQIAQGYGYKSYAKAPLHGQETIRGIAARINEEEAQPPAPQQQPASMTGSAPTAPLVSTPPVAQTAVEAPSMTAATMKEPLFAKSAMEREGNQLGRYLAKQGITPDQAATMGDQQIAASAKAAGVAMPGQQRWALALRRLRLELK